MSYFENLGLFLALIFVRGFFKSTFLCSYGGSLILSKGEFFMDLFCFGLSWVVVFSFLYSLFVLYY